MENNIKSKVFTVIYAVVLIAALIGAVQLLYNAIEMMTYTTFGEHTFGKLQKPLAIISLLAAIFAFIGVAAGVTSFCAKGKTAKTVCHALMLVAVVAMVVFVIACSSVWLSYYKGEYSDYGKPPYNISSSSQGTRFTLYSAVMAMLVPQLAYFAVLSALHIWELVKSLKNKRVAQTADKNGVATEEETV